MGSGLLRPATWRDIPVLAQWDRDLFGAEAWSDSTWWEEFAARPRRSYVVAEEAGEVVGYAGLDCGGTTADVMTVAVIPQVRGSGLGRQLVTHLAQTAATSGAEALMLEVRADNEPARRLYDSLGFAELTVRRRYYQPGDVDAVIMRKLLEAS